MEQLSKNKNSMAIEDYNFQKQFLGLISQIQDGLGDGSPKVDGVIPSPILNNEPISEAT